MVRGRGLLPKDESFVIGFTMGSTDRVDDRGAAVRVLLGRFGRIRRELEQDLLRAHDAIEARAGSGCAREPASVELTSGAFGIARHRPKIVRAPRMRRRGRNEARFMLGVVLVGGAVAYAHVDPPGCASTGVALTVSALRGDGKVGLFGPASECERLSYKVTIRKADPAACSFSGGRLTLATPDGVVHTISDDLPCIGATGREEAGDPATFPCREARQSLESPLIPYAVRATDVASGIVAATARYVGGSVHDTPTDTPGVSAIVDRRVEVVFCTDADPATSERCDPAKAGAAACWSAPPPLAPNASFDRPYCPADGSPMP